MLIGLLKRLVGRNPTSDKVAMTSELAEVDRLALLGDLGAAIVRCQAMRERFGAQVPILVKLGSLLARSGAVVEARELLERVLAVEPEHFEAIFALGTLSLIEGRFEEAGRQLDLALVQQPDNSAVLLNRGQVAMRTRAFDVAVNCFRQALACNPCNPEAAEPLFYLLIQLEAYDAALDLVDGLIASEPDNGRWWRMKGFLLFKRYYEPEEAERCFALAESSQASDAAYWTERGICARDRGVLHQALACFEQALTLSPTDPLAKFHRGLTHLYAENYAAGWPDYEARFADAGLQAVKLPGKPWGGGGLAGAKLVVVAEQGLGDEIMFASCLGDLPTDGHVTVSCTARLIPIFQASFPALEVVDKDEMHAIPSDALWSIAAGSLPRLYRPTRESFPRKPYLRASDFARQRVRHFIDDLPPGRRIGISWRGGTEMTRRRLRVLPLADLAQLLCLSDVQWISLQYGDCTADLRELKEVHGLSLQHPQALLDDYDATAALVEQLDLIVTVCTAIVHLAGALGKEVWVLAPKVPEWRYGLSFQFMPWYRQVEVLRQDDAGDWSQPLNELLMRLKAG